MNCKQLSEFKKDIATQFLKDLEAKGELEQWATAYKASDKDGFFDEVENIAYAIYKQSPNFKKALTH